jgi:TolB-like protein/tetratricopeptide (TPR) repeat protein
MVLGARGGFAQRIVALPPPCDLGGPSAARPIAAPARGDLSLAVIPLSIGAGGTPLAFLADGFADAVAERVAVGAPKIDVLGASAYRRRGGDSLSVRAISAETGVRYVLTGHVTGSRDVIRIAVTLFDVKAGNRKWAHTYLYDSTGALPIEQSVSVEVASRITTISAAERARFSRATTQSAAAYSAMLRGDGAATESKWADAANAYRQALRTDRSFAKAFAKLALADAELLERGVEAQGGVTIAAEMRASADRALALDSSSVLTSVAEARSRLLQGSPTSVWRRAFDRALAIDPRNGFVLEAYGLALAQIGERTQGREMLHRSIRATGGDAAVWGALAEIAFNDRRDGDACSALNQAVADDPLFAPAWALRALLRARHDDLRFAWADAETATRLGSELLGQAASARVDLVARDTARARNRLYTLWRNIRARGVVSARDGGAVAAALLAAGQPPRALDVLENVRPRGPWFAAMLRAPSFDRVRKDPRFRALAEPQAWSGEARLGAETPAASASSPPRPNDPSRSSP